MNAETMVNAETMMSVRAFARHRGVGASYVHRLVMNGTLARDATGKIDVGKADRIMDDLRAHAAPGRLLANARRKRKLPTSGNGDAGAGHGSEARSPASGNGSGGTADDLVSDGASWVGERRRMARADADLREMERDQRRGLLCEVERVQSAAADIGAAIRRTLKQLPARIGARIAAESGINIRQCVALLDSEIDRALEQAADELAALPEAIRGRR